MIEVRNNKFNLSCDKCGCTTKNIIELNDDIMTYITLCDDCLQELNRKIVDHLAEKNL